VEEAIERLAEGWDAIVCELTMPETAGMALYHAALRRAPGQVARIVFTTSGALTARSRAFLEGVKRPCVSKPIDAGELKRAIALVLR
jgi:CheY-like chemotaxis protein